MLALDFLYDDMGTMKRSRNLTWSIGFFAVRDPAFDPFGLAPGECKSERSTLTENAPFPVGPLKDAGASLGFALPSKMLSFTRQKEANPAFGFSYHATGLQVGDFVAGAASFSGAGGAEVGPFSVAMQVPADFTTTPDLLGPTVKSSGPVTVGFDPPGASNWLEVSWNDISGSTVTALTRIACRAAEGASAITLPTAEVVRGTAVNLLATRASVTGFSTSGTAQGRFVLGIQKAGSLIVSR
jgi:hypothetical protein